MRVLFLRRIAVLSAALISLPSGFGQQAASDHGSAPMISVESRLVNIPVVVRNDKGVLPLNLKKEDFSLLVDGKQQTIRYFDLDTDLPLTLGLLVDTSGSVRNVLDDERTASSAFLDNMMATKDDKAFVIQFARSVELLQDVTPSRPKLQAALKEIDAQPPDRGSQDTNDRAGNDPSSGGRDDSRGQGRGRGIRFGGGTTLYDAVFLASDEVIAKQKGRKALILLTDGVDRGSKESLASAIEAAQRADTIVYAIYFKREQPRQEYGERRGGGYPRGGGGWPGGGGGWPGGGGGGRRGGGYPGGAQQQVDGKKILERITQETGGRMFEVSKKDTFASIYDQIGQELRSQYRLGYIPDADTASDGYHKIDLAFTNKDKKKYTIQTRDGYYTGGKSSVRTSMSASGSDGDDHGR